MVNLQDGDWDLTDLKYTTLPEEAQKPFLLKKGDLCFNRTNGSKDLVGKCAVFIEDDESYIFASYVIRVRLADQHEYLPEFLARFLNSSVGRVQVDQISRQALMTNINSEEIRELRVPHPPIGIQEQMVKELHGHDLAKQRRLADVADLLAAGDREIAKSLQVVPARPGPVGGYAVSRRDLSSSGRMNVEFFHPERVRIIRSILNSAIPASRLDEMASFVREQISVPRADDFYVGLANVARNTGELRLNMEDEMPEGPCMKFRTGDVLFGKLRPYLNKVHLAERDGVCSPEFLVLRVKEDVRAEYLAAVLRSEIMLAQTRHMASGNTHPRLTTSDLHEMMIPRPEAPLQDNIAAIEQENRARAREIKHTAVEEWAAAKARFGDGLVHNPSS